jgi:hypothetical protein
LLASLRLLDPVHPVLLPRLSLFDLINTLLLTRLGLLALDMPRLALRHPLFTLNLGGTLRRTLLAYLLTLSSLLPLLRLLPHFHASTALLCRARATTIATALNVFSLGAIMSTTIARLRRRRGRNRERSNARRKN